MKSLKKDMVLRKGQTTNTRGECKNHLFKTSFSRQALNVYSGENDLGANQSSVHRQAALCFPDAREVVFRNRFSQWWRTFLPLAQRDQVRRVESALLRSWDHSCARVPPWKRYNLQRPQAWERYSWLGGPYKTDWFWSQQTLGHRWQNDLYFLWDAWVSGPGDRAGHWAQLGGRLVVARPHDLRDAQRNKSF